MSVFCIDGNCCVVNVNMSYILVMMPLFVAKPDIIQVSVIRAEGVECDSG